MPVPTNMGVSLTDTQLEDAKLSLQSVKDQLNGLISINLTKPERSAIQSVSDERLPFVQRTFDDLIGNNRNLLPPFSDLDEAKANYAYMVQTGSLKVLLLQVLEILSDHELASGALAFEYMRDFYDVAKRAAERNVPGADSVVDALSPLFERANPGATVPPVTDGGSNPTV